MKQRADAPQAEQQREMRLSLRYGRQPDVVDVHIGTPNDELMDREKTEKSGYTPE